jgi:ribosomal protein S1
VEEDAGAQVPAAGPAGEASGATGQRPDGTQPQKAQEGAGGKAAEAALTPPPTLRQGAVVDGTVTAVTADQVLVDVGGKADGVLPAAEAVVPPGQTLAQAFQPGQTVTVTILGFDPEAGAPRLSQRRALTAAAWRRVERAFREGTPLEGTVREAVKGGLALDVGVRAFLPASHVAERPVGDLTPFVGRTLAVKVIEFDRSRHKVIVSRRVLLEEERRRRQEALWAEIAEGQVREGTVKALTDFGAFIDLGGVDGLLHVSAMSWGRVGHPSEVVTPGQTIRVKVLKVDRERQKISLGLKQILPDPWETVEERYPVGSLVQGRVARLSPFGAFVELEPGVDGLVHISQLADWHVRDPRDVVQEGETVTVKVLQVSAPERRIRLSLREAQGAGAPPPPRRGEFTVGERLRHLGTVLEEGRGGSRPGPA